MSKDGELKARRIYLELLKVLIGRLLDVSLENSGNTPMCCSSSITLDLELQWRQSIQLYPPHVSDSHSLARSSGSWFAPLQPSTVTPQGPHVIAKADRLIIGSTSG
jgi:hypothetical protein